MIAITSLPKVMYCSFYVLEFVMSFGSVRFMFVVDLANGSLVIASVLFLLIFTAVSCNGFRPWVLHFENLKLPEHAAPC